MTLSPVSIRKRVDRFNTWAAPAVAVGGAAGVAVAVAVGVALAVAVGVLLGDGDVLHLPALPASAIALISPGSRARLKYSTSSITPANNWMGQPHPLKLFWMIAPISTGSGSVS